MELEAQTDRIREKLEAARQADPDLRAFGAIAHRYAVNPPADEACVAEFEAEHGISLPEAYRAFLTRVGNGGPASDGSAAGPFYGIYPLGTNLDALVTDPRESLRREPSIGPGLSEEAWEARTRALRERGPADDDSYEAAIGSFYGGILPLGSQGCTFLHGLLLAGPHRGRVVYLDQDHEAPRFAWEADFLGWYERWLDEVLSGDLLQEDAPWFGLAMGGPESVLVERCRSSGDDRFRAECLEGLLGKAHLRPETLAAVEREVGRAGRASRTALQVLAKHDLDRARPFLDRLFRSDPRFAFQIAHWYAGDRVDDWVDEIRRILADPDPDPDLFRHAALLAGRCRADLTPAIAPFAGHADGRLREPARWFLFESEKRKR